MEHLYNWVFTYYPLTEKWAACPIEHLDSLKNDYNTDKAIKSSSIDTLIWMIEKGEGNLDKVNSLPHD